uniref:Uncharacterized protein n=1 Tax=Plectus sambesii TaxID=2011161 RepID=A0A914XIB7_9BILA
MKEERLSLRKRNSPYEVFPSSLLLLSWVGRYTTSLAVTTVGCFFDEHLCLETVHGVFEALNAERAYPKLTHLKIASCCLLFDNANILDDLLTYVEKRQEQANADGQRFLHSLTLVTSPKRCCIMKILQCLTASKSSELIGAWQVTRPASCAHLRQLPEPAHFLVLNECFFHLSITSDDGDVYYAVDKEPDRLLEEAVLQLVNYSGWAAPVVIAPKPGGQIGLSADFSSGLNASLDLHH